jgi:hypothetical protein
MVHDHLHDTWIVEVFGLVEPLAQRAHSFPLGGEQRLHRVVDRRRGNERLIALHVHDEIRLERRRNFREPIGARGVIGARHHRDAAELVHDGGDFFVVGGDDDRVDASGVRGARPLVLDHRFAVDERERLARQARRPIARGNDSDDSGVTEGTCQF